MSSHLFSRNERQVEIYIGALDSVPNGVTPIDESRIIRREPWQRPIEAAAQHDKDVAASR